MADSAFPFKGVHVCQDSPNRLNDLTKADVVKPGEDQTDLRPPEGAQLASRAQELGKIKVERITLNKDGPATKEDSGHLDMNSVVKRENAQAAPQGELHKDAALEMGVEAQGIPAMPASAAPENGVGVQPVQRTVTNLSDKTPVNVQTNQEKVAHDEVQPEPPKAPPTENEPANQISEAVEVAPVQGSSGGSAPAQVTFRADQVAPKPARHKVVISSPKMGRHRVRVDKLAVSSSVIILGYVDDEDSVIVEPPIAEDASDSLTIEHGGKSYECVYYGFTAEMPIDGQEILLVVLVRTDC